MSRRQPAIVDASALISLAQIDMVHLLAAVYSDVMIPEGVAREIAPTVGPLPTWIEVEPAPERWPQCADRLGLGERHVLGLAQRRPHATLVLDDMRARRCGIESGFAVRGTAGVLVDAKGMGVIPAVAPLLECMVSRGTFIDVRTRRLILLEAGESPNGS